MCFRKKNFFVFSIFFIAIVLIELSVSAQSLSAQGIWAAGGGKGDIGYSVHPTNDNGFITGGLTYSYGSGNADAFVIKSDSDGNLQWTKTIGGAEDDMAYSILSTVDSGYVIAGATNSFGEGNYDVFVVKSDSVGNIQWAKTIGRSAEERGYCISATSDNGYVIGGFTASFGTGDKDFYLIKLDSTGAIQWTKTFGGLNEDVCRSVLSTNDNGFILCGYTNSTGAGNYDMCIIKTDSTGNLEWAKTIGGVNEDYGYAAIQTSQNNFMLCGYTNSFGAGSYDVYLVELSNNGNLLFTKTIGKLGNETGMSISLTSNSGYIICGQSISFSAGGMDAYIIKLDSTATVRFSKTIGSTDYEVGYCIRPTHNGDFLMTGMTTSFGVEEDVNVYIVKMDSNANTCNSILVSSDTGTGGIINNCNFTDSTGGAMHNCNVTVDSGGSLQDICAATDVKTQSSISSITIFPNPASSIIYWGSHQKINSIEIFSTIGSKVYFTRLRNNESVIHLPDISSGIYFVQLNTVNGAICKKIVIER